MRNEWTVVMRESRITIPAEIRRRWGIQPGDRMEFVQEGASVRVVPLVDVVARTAGIAGKYREGPTPTIKELKEAMERAIAEDVVARMSR